MFMRMVLLSAMCGAPVCDVWCSYSVTSIGWPLCLEGFSLFKQGNKVFFADQDIYLLAYGVKYVRHRAI